MTYPARRMLRTAATAFDLRGARRYRVLSDAEALRADMAAVGRDLRVAVERYAVGR